MLSCARRRWCPEARGWSCSSTSFGAWAEGQNKDTAGRRAAPLQFETFWCALHAPLVLFALPVSYFAFSLGVLSTLLSFLFPPISAFLFSFLTQPSICSFCFPPCCLCFPLPAPSWPSGARTPGAAVPRCWLRLQPLPLFSVHTAVSTVGQDGR